MLSNRAGLKRNAADGLFTKPSKLLPQVKHIEKARENFRIAAEDRKRGRRVFDRFKQPLGQNCPENAICRTKMGEIRAQKIRET